MDDFDFSCYYQLILDCKNKHIKGIESLITVLKTKYGIEHTEEKDNVCFKKGDQEYRIAKQLFYRVSGQCVYAYETGDIYKKAKLVGVKEFTDDLFYNKMKMFILFAFKIETV